MTTGPSTSPKTGKSLRYRLGMLCLAVSFISPLLALGVPLLGLGKAASATLVGALLVGGPEVFLILGAALAGKEALEAIKSKVRALFGRKTPGRQAGRGRYATGLVLLVAGNVFLLTVAYEPFLSGTVITQDTRLYFDLAGDLIIIIGFFLLGEQFWEKLKRLFTWEPAEAWRV